MHVIGSLVFCNNFFPLIELKNKTNIQMNFSWSDSWIWSKQRMMKGWLVAINGTLLNMSVNLLITDLGRCVGFCFAPATLTGRERNRNFVRPRWNKNTSSFTSVAFFFVTVFGTVIFSKFYFLYLANLCTLDMEMRKEAGVMNGDLEIVSQLLVLSVLDCIFSCFSYL